jgi:hypothetical protein
LAGEVALDGGREEVEEAGRWAEVEVEKARVAIGKNTDRSGFDVLATEAIARREEVV